MSKITIEQQRDYVNILWRAWLKTLRVCGPNSSPEMGMLDALAREKAKLREMEGDDVSN